ncbi:TonB-dependent receptor [Pedobacter deserti]|uniref:TonB-dependent receptor n=1 Tax=Pedobacter deserti TaxID=2817382 RepID=UPI00210A67E4|nr:TonB-dependent receptor [Pedobacter sp. SYSU D00382]
MKFYTRWIMRINITAILLLVTLLQVSAGGYSQEVTYIKRKATLEQLFREITRQTGFSVFYPDSRIDKNRSIEAHFNKTPLSAVLGQVFEGTNYTFEIEGKHIIVSSHPGVQQETVKGKVTDELGKPLANVNVRLKASNRATVSDSGGAFEIVVPNGGGTLIFSSIGYITKEQKAVQGMTVAMESAMSQLNETVVVGYGTARRKDLTGSVASVDLGEIRNVPFATVDQALAGKAPGVQVVQADGSPGGVAKIRIRGGTSLSGGNDPLYIIDGIPVQIQNRYLQSAADILSPIESFGADSRNNTVSGAFARGLNSLGGLNINDIETIDILKDASATAIYGSRAANGVVIITTKTGKLNQKPVFEANYYTGLSTAVNEKVLNRDQYIMVLKEAAKNLNDLRAARTPALPPNADATNILSNPNYFGTANTDWLDLVSRTGVTQNADISVRGGGTGSRYYTSIAYNKNNGTVIGTDFTRIGGKINLDNEINRKLRFTTNLDYGFTTNNITNGLYMQALFAPPTVDPYNADGTVKIFDVADNGADSFRGFQNPLLLTKGVNKGNMSMLIGSIAGEYEIVGGLKFRSNVLINHNSYRQTNYIPSTVLVVTSPNSWPASSNNGIATQSQSQSVDLLYENTLTWNKEFNENNRLTLLAGSSWQRLKTSSFSASGQGFPDDVYLNNLSSATLTLPAKGISGQSALLSFYARANYALFERYLFTFTGRSDASSKFPKNNRVGYFPSGGVAWRISDENFLKGTTWIDEIKLRVSAGYTGTQNIGDNMFYTLYRPVSYAGLSGMRPSQLGNDEIKWESSLQKDAGIDFAFFKGRLGGGFSYYEKSTSGVLFPATVASSSGFTGVTANIANIRNRGLELSMRGDFIRNANLQWSGTFNISGNRSKVLALSNDFADPNNPKIYTYGNTVLRVGEPVGLIYGNVFEGIIQTPEEALDYKNRNFYSLYGDLDLVGPGDAKYALGNPIYLQYSDFRKDIIGNAEPKFYGGYTNSITYKNLSLITLATFSYGNDIFYLADTQNQHVGTKTNKGIRILDRWTPENTGSSRPRLVLGKTGLVGASSNNVYDASFIKLKSVTLNYQMPKEWLNRLKIDNASVYVSGTNLFTVTNYPGADPEVSNDPYSLIGGYSDAGGYPTVRQFSLGLRCGF